MKLIKSVGKKTGKPICRFSMSEQEYSDLCNDQMGLCLRCGEDRSNCEPDARGYECESCGEKAVYGTEECLMRGWIDITE